MSAGDGAGAQTARVNSWKEIAAYLGRSERTVRRWEEKEGLPVHRLQHEYRGSVFAYTSELDAWWESKRRSIDRDEASPVSGGQTDVSSPAASRLHRVRFWAITTGAVIVLIAAAAGLVSRRGAPRVSTISSIAVLPFQNLSPDSGEDWFTDGMTETLIAELAQLRTLKVISRSSVIQYRNTKKPIKQIAAELGVDAVVEGSVIRAGNRVRITAQLIAASTDAHLWARDFDRDLNDVLALHHDVAGAIAREVGHAVKPDAPRTAEPQAMAAYLKGRYQLNRGALKSAVDLARDAIRTDPKLPEAHELLGESLILAGDFGAALYRNVVPEARAALQRALELRPERDRGNAYSWLGWTYFVLEHDWQEAERLMRRGFELDPKSGNNYAFLLLGLGRPEQAVGIMDRVLSYDPANPFLITDAGAVYQSARRYDEAIVLYRKAQELSPGMAYARIFEPYAVLLAGRPDEAFDRWMWSADGKGPLGMGEEFRTLYKTGGWPAVWKRYIEKFPEKAPRRFDIYALIMLGRRQEAIRELEALEQVGDSWLIRLTDPIFDSLRQELRFQALMKRIGYPASVIGR